MPKEKYAKLSPLHVGLAFGIVWSLGVFILGLISQNGYCSSFVSMMGECYLGYSSGFLGSLKGLIWGFFDGFIGGFIFAWLYNKLIK